MDVDLKLSEQVVDPVLWSDRIRLDRGCCSVEGFRLELWKVLQEPDPDVLDEIWGISRLQDDVRDIREGNTHRLKVYPALRRRSSMAYILVDGRYEIARLSRPARTRSVGQGSPHQAESENPSGWVVKGMPQLPRGRIHGGTGVRDSVLLPQCILASQAVCGIIRIHGLLREAYRPLAGPGYRGRGDQKSLPTRYCEVVPSAFPVVGMHSHRAGA